VIAADLEPTPAYEVRSFEWLPTIVGEGVLTIRQRRTAGGQEDADVYAVEEQVAPEPGVREFLLVNATDPEQPDAYRVQIGPRGHTCTCKAAKCRLESCKHRDALQAIHQKGEVTCTR
jgi:hypothetical protein